MKRVMLMMVLAALLLTQCKKPSIEFPTPSVTTTVNMTITAGPGSKTDITTEEGRITWSEGDKIYVGDGSKYIGCLSIVSGVGNATGTFTGDVTATAGDDCTFHFYYLGSAKDYSKELTTGESASTSVEVDFSSQDIHADGRGNLTNASKHHVGYGKAEHVKVEADKPVTGLQVSMKSKVAIAYFSFESGTETPTPYRGALTLSGERIYNKMTVKFNESDFRFTGTEGDISLTNTTTHLKYAMLVPTGSTAEEILNFGGVVTGSTTLANGIEANKFYRVDGSMPIVVTVTKPKFSVDGSGTTVEFSPGNLWYGKADGESTAAFHFEANQWSTTPASDGTWNPSHVSHFFWSNTTDWQTSGKEPYASSYSHSTLTTSDVFFTEAEGFHVGNETGWRTLSNAEWNYLLSINPNAGEQGGQQEGFGREDALKLSKWSAVTFGESGPTVSGLIIMPDGWEGTLTETTAYTTWQELEASGAVFLPSVGYRNGTSVSGVGSDDNYWSSTPRDEYASGEDWAWYMGFGSDYVKTSIGFRSYGGAVRLVR